MRLNIGSSLSILFVLITLSGTTCGVNRRHCLQTLVLVNLLLLLCRERLLSWVLLVDLGLAEWWHLLERLLLVGVWRGLDGVLLSLVLEVSGSELEFGEVDEDLLERGACQSEV